MSEREKDVLIQFQPKHERVRPQSAPHHHIRKMGTDEERIKIRMALRALDERDLEANIVHWLKHAALQGTEDTPRLLLAELFHGLDSSNVNGRKQRFRLARHLITTSAYVEVHDIVPSIIRTLVKRASEEKSQGLYEEEAKFLQDLTDSALTLAHVQDTREWVHHTCVKPFLDIISKTLDGKKIAGCCRHLIAVLSACTLSTHIDLDISQDIAREVLKRMHKLFHHHRKTSSRIPESYQVQEKCIEIIQLELTPSNIQTFVEQFMTAIDNKDTWHVRKAGLEMLTTISTVYVDASKFPGDSEAREVLRKYMGIIQGCLDKARYDKIVHVRKAMQKAQAAFNGIALVPFEDYDVQLEDLHLRQVGAPSNPRRAAHTRKRFTRPKAKIGNDFGIQIFVPMEDENESPEKRDEVPTAAADNADDPKDAPSPSTSSPDRIHQVEDLHQRHHDAEQFYTANLVGNVNDETFNSRVFQDSLAAEDTHGHSQHMSISDHTLESLVTIHAQEIEKFYREKEKEELQNLKIKFEKHFKRLQEAFERDTMKVKGVIQNAIDNEIDFFKKDRLPKLAKLLSDRQSSASDQN